MLEKLERLANANINLLPAAEITTHFVLERNGFVALVERRNDDFGRVGSAGMLTDSGFAALVWRGREAYFVARNFEQQATPGQIGELRQFQNDLEQALG